MSQSTPPIAVSSIPMPIASGGVLVASVCFGLVPYFTKSLTDQGVAPYAVTFYRFISAATLLLPVLISQHRWWREILWGMLAGVLLGVGWIGYATALRFVPVSTVGVLYMTYPVFTILVAWCLFSDRPTPRSVLAAALIVVAAAIAGSPAAADTAQIPYLLASLAAPFGLGFAISVLVHKLHAISPPARIASASLGAVLGLAPLMATSDASQIFPDAGSGWILIIGIGLGTALLPQMIFVICSPIVGAARTSILGSVELPTMFVVGFLAFAEPIGAAQAVACCLIVLAIFLADRTPRNKLKSNSD